MLIFFFFAANRGRRLRGAPPRAQPEGGRWLARILLVWEPHAGWRRVRVFLPSDSVPRKWVPGYRHHFTTWDRKPPSCDPLLRLRRLRTPWEPQVAIAMTPTCYRPSPYPQNRRSSRARAWSHGGRRTPPVGQSTGVWPAAGMLWCSMTYR